MSLECDLVHDTDTPEAMLLMQSGELVFYYPYLSIFKNVEKNPKPSDTVCQGICVHYRMTESHQ